MAGRCIGLRRRSRFCPVRLSAIKNPAAMRWLPARMSPKPWSISALTRKPPADCSLPSKPQKQRPFLRNCVHSGLSRCNDHWPCQGQGTGKIMLYKHGQNRLFPSADFDSIGHQQKHRCVQRARNSKNAGLDAYTKRAIAISPWRSPDNPNRRSENRN